jgi:hypothetical protein
MKEVLEIYTPEQGPLLEFIRALRALYEKYGYIYGDGDGEQVLKELIQKEYSAEFVKDTRPKLVFESAKQKTMFLLKFN